MMRCFGDTINSCLVREFRQGSFLLSNRAEIRQIRRDTGKAVRSFNFHHARHSLQYGQNHRPFPLRQISQFLAETPVQRGGTALTAREPSGVTVMKTLRRSRSPRQREINPRRSRRSRMPVIVGCVSCTARANSPLEVRPSRHAARNVAICGPVSPCSSTSCREWRSTARTMCRIATASASSIETRSVS